MITVTREDKITIAFTVIGTVIFHPLLYIYVRLYHELESELFFEIQKPENIDSDHSLLLILLLLLSKSYFI